MRLEEFRGIRENAKQYIREAEQLLQQDGIIHNEQIQMLQQMEMKLATDAFDVLIVGEFSSGKSTLINGILGKPLLPTHVSPTTATINIIQYGEKESAQVVFHDSTKQSIPVADLVNYITSLSSEADARAKTIDYVNLSYPSIFCRNGVRLVDTPGLNSMHDDHERATMQYLPRGSAGIMAISALQFMSKSQRDYLACFRSYMNKMFFLITMVDEMDEDDDFKENEDYFRRTLAEVLQKPVEDIKLYPVNAKVAEQGDLKTSGLGVFLQDFEAFLTADQLAHEMLFVPVQKALDFTRQYRTQKQLEYQAVSVPYDEFERRVQETLPKRQAIELERANVCSLLARDSQTSMSLILQHMEHSYREMVQDAVAYVENYDGDLKTHLKEDLQMFLKRRSVEFTQETDSYIRREYESLSQKINLASLQLKAMLEDYQTTLGIASKIEATVDENVMMSNVGSFLGSLGIFSAMSAVLALILGPLGVLAAMAACFFGMESISKKLANIGRRTALNDMAAKVKQELMVREGSCKRKLADALEAGNQAMVEKMDEKYKEPLLAIDRTLEKIKREQQEAERTAAIRRQHLQKNISAAQAVIVKLDGIMHDFA